MHHALVLSVFSSTFLVLITLSGTTGDAGSQFPSADDNSLLQIQAQPQSALMPEDMEEEKRSWKDLQNDWGKRGWKDLHAQGWGKRGWKDLQGTGWGKRSWGDLRNERGKRDQNSLDKRAWSDLKGGSWGKRDWSQFHGGWGKRYSLDDQLTSLYNPERFEEDDDDLDDDLDEDLLEDEKRAWSNLKGQWGKRDWSSFKGSWGKRDPAWNNLKGLWGKRSVDSKWAKLQGGWGKRTVGGTPRMKSPGARK